MLVNIAWKNIWRNKVRSSVVITSVILGLWAGAFILSYAFGMINQRLEDAIKNEVSHIQVHHPDYSDDFDPKLTIANNKLVISTLEQSDMVHGFSDRVLSTGMVASPSASTGGKIIGIDPYLENEVTELSKFIIMGDYLVSNEKNKVIIGQRMAEKLNVKIRSKIVLTFQDINGDIVAGAFRVYGIYRSSNSSLERVNIYVNKSDLSRLLGLSGEVHEIAILMNSGDDVNVFAEKLRTKNNELLIETWNQVSPELGLMIESLDQYMLIFFVIILLALSFGIVNTMLMAVLERVREIGMLMAIGMNKSRLFGMIALETIFMVIIAAPIGLVLAYFTINWFHTHGLDISGIYQEGYAAYGFKSIIYPELETVYYLRIMLLVMITAVLASVYPAFTALRLDPVKAIRKI